MHDMQSSSESKYNLIHKDLECDANKVSSSTTASSESSSGATSTSTTSTSSLDNIPVIQGERGKCEISNEISMENDKFPPPINREILKDLELDVIFKDVCIVHELVMDPNLKIKPNYAKRPIHPSSSDYWNQIQKDISQISKKKLLSPRLVNLIEEVKELMISMYPMSESVMFHMKETFSIESLMEEIQNDSLNVISCIHILAALMKENCAPRRDPLVNKLTEYAEKEKYVDMFQLCLEILELMKLDILNYKISKVMPNILKNFASRERQFFNEKCLNGELNYGETLKWLKSLHFKHENDSPFGLFTRGIISFAARAGFVICFPEIMQLDKNRLEGIHDNYQNICIKAICIAIFKCWTRGHRNDYSIEDLLNRLSSTINRNFISVDQLFDHLILSIKTCIKMPIGNGDLIKNLLSNYIRADSSMNIMWIGRLELVLVKILLENGKPDYKKYGLNDLRDEIHEFSTKLQHLIRVQWTVHSDVIECLIERIRKS